MRLPDCSGRILAGGGRGSCQLGLGLGWEMRNLTGHRGGPEGEEIPAGTWNWAMPARPGQTPRSKPGGLEEPERQVEERAARPQPTLPTLSECPARRAE